MIRREGGKIKMYEQVMIMNSDILGQGNEEVGQTLLGTYLRKLLAHPVKPDAILFYNSGVKLLTKESYFLDVLDALEKSGVELLACGTCVYKVCGQRSLTVGRISNMEEMTDIIIQARKVVTL